MDIQQNVLVPMPDGTRLAADVYRPEEQGAYPAIMEYTCYRKDLIDAESRRRRYEYFVEHGYACLVYDVRGTGNSEGLSTDMYAAADQRDGYDMVEWIAGQPWCNGNVGMWGISYCGVVTLQTAMQAPPHLKAIIVRSATDDIFWDWTNPGGSPRPYIYEFYAPTMAALNFLPPDPQVYGDRWEELWQRRLDGNQPWSLGFLNHLVRDDYWLERSLRPDYARIRCPTFVIDGWADWYFTPLLRVFSNINVPRKVLIGPWSHWWPHEAVPGPRIDTLAESLRWFDTWLKGMDTGITEEPPATVFVREYQKPVTMRLQDKGYWRSGREWPFPGTRRVQYLLGAAGALDFTTRPGVSGTYHHEYDPAVRLNAGRHGGGAFPAWGRPTDQREDEARCLVFTTSVQEKNIELIGRPAAILFVSSSQPVAGLSLKLCDVAPDGTSSVMTGAYLNLAYRRSAGEPEPLEPSRVYEAAVEFLALAYRLKKGHRLRLSIGGADFQNAWPLPSKHGLSIYYGPQHPSRLLLPIAPRLDRRAKPAQLTALPAPTKQEIERPVYTITLSIPDGRVITSCKVSLPGGYNRSRYTVSAKNPAKAAVRSTTQIRIGNEDNEINVRADCLTKSDAGAFHHRTRVKIRSGGKIRFSKSWSISVPRRHN